MIELTDISKSFDGKTVLTNISLTFEKGSTHVLLGSSGCGKSTLLRIISGLIPADSGTVRIEETSISPSNQPEIAPKLGYVIQEGGLFPHLTAGQNVSLVAKTLGWELQKIEHRLNELAELVGLEKSHLVRFPKQISGGQRQRVALMRALMLDPSTLLLDEPLGSLDPIIRTELQSELKRVFNSLKKTVVLVTHDIGEAAYFGHTVTLLNEGVILQHGKFEDLLRNPSASFVTEFINAQRPAPGLKELL